MRKILILAIMVSLVLVGGAFAATAQAQTPSNTCSYQGCALTFNTSPCSWVWSALLPWNWNWSALNPYNWRSACRLKFESNPNPARSSRVAEATQPARAEYAIGPINRVALSP